MPKISEEEKKKLEEDIKRRKQEKIERQKEKEKRMYVYISDYPTLYNKEREPSDRVPDSRPRAAGLSLICVTALWSLSKTHLS